jgi:hypothetical protein
MRPRHRLSPIAGGGVNAPYSPRPLAAAAELPDAPQPERDLLVESGHATTSASAA